MDTSDPTALHFLERGTPTEIAQAIVRAAPAVAAVSRNLANCLDMAGRWSLTLTQLGIDNLQLGRQGLTERGGYLEPGSQVTCDHHFLAVGNQLHLFDPTAGQFAQPVEIGRYVVADGTRFVDWRTQELERRANTGAGTHP